MLEKCVSNKFQKKKQPKKKTIKTKKYIRKFTKTMKIHKR